MNAVIFVALLAATSVFAVNPNNVNYKKGLTGRVLLSDGPSSGDMYATNNNNNKRSRVSVGGVSTLGYTPNNKLVEEVQPEMTIDINGPSTQTGRLHYNFRHHYAKYINPRYVDSHFEFLNVKDQYVADSATFLREGLSSVDMVVIPFKKYVPIDSPVAILSGYESMIVNKHRFVVEDGKKLMARATFAVKLYNIEDQPFGKNVVSNSSDDPSLAAGGLSLVAHGPHGLAFSVVGTNKGIWAVYERNRIGLVEHPEYNDKVFTIFHRLADRQSTDEVIDASIVYDKSQNCVTFKLNNETVHTIEHVGKLDKNDKNITYLSVESRQDLAKELEPTDFTVMIGAFSLLDAVDPNNPTDSARNQRLSSDPNVYDVKAKFSDDEGKKELNLWGQSAAITIYDLEITLKEEGSDVSTKIVNKHGKNNTNVNNSRQARLQDDEGEDSEVAAGKPKKNANKKGKSFTQTRAARYNYPPQESGPSSYVPVDNNENENEERTN